MIVLSLCAMVNTVQSSNWVLIVDWMRSSVSRSIAAVASSRMRILVFLRRARAKHTSCLWPTLRTQQVGETQSYREASHSRKTNTGSSPQVLSSLWTLQLQLCRLVADKLVEVRMFQSFPHLFVVVLLEGVEVHPESPREQDRLLQQRRDTQMQVWWKVAVIRGFMWCVIGERSLLWLQQWILYIRYYYFIYLVVF